MLDPIVKWAGGKSWLELPQHTGTWIEPFAGGAAQFWRKLPERAILCDLNHRLISMYAQVRDHRGLVQAMLPTAVETDLAYKTLRELFNSCGSAPLQATLFLTLNRTCFNGLWRENKKGAFNVPWCRDPKRSVQRDLRAHSEALRGALLVSGDFRAATLLAQPGDTVYMDPPYYETFDTYQPGGFSAEDHVRLAIEASRLRLLGCQVWISYNDHPSIRALYQDWFIAERTAPRGIRGGRSSAPELLISARSCT